MQPQHPTNRRSSWPVPVSRSATASLTKPRTGWPIGFGPKGCAAGDHIAILAENNPRYFEVFWAALRSGLYITAINRFLSPEEAAYIVNDSNSTVLITTAAMAETAAGMADLIPQCPKRLMMDETAPGFDSYEAAVAAMPTEALAEQPAGDVMLYSSGTTGRPKGIKRQLSGLQINDPERSSLTMLMRFLLEMDENSVYLSPAPLYHAAPLQWCGGIHELGGTVDCDGEVRRGEVPRVRRTLFDHRHAGCSDHVRAHAQAPRRGACRI